MGKKKDIELEVRELEKEIESCDRAYFDKASSVISDYKYDCLVEKLEDFYKKYKWLKKE